MKGEGTIAKSESAYPESTEFKSMRPSVRGGRFAAPVNLASLAPVPAFTLTLGDNTGTTNVAVRNYGD